jgi:hypothetical protein
MAYNTTGINGSTFVEFLTQTNTMVATSHNVSLFGVIIIIIQFVLFLGLMRRWSMVDSAIASSFVVSIVGSLFVFANLASFIYIWPSVIILIFSLIAKVWSGE